MAEITIPGMFLTGTHAARPAATAVGSGSLYSCSDHDLIYQSDGAAWSTWADLTGTSVGLGAWTSYTPALTGSTSNPTVGNGVIEGRYKLLDAKTMLWTVFFQYGSTSAAGSGNWRFSLPAGVALATNITKQVGVGSLLDNGATNYVLAVEFLPSVANDRTYEIHVADGTNPRNLAHNAPMAWAAGDHLTLSAFLELA